MVFGRLKRLGGNKSKECGIKYGCKSVEAGQEADDQTSLDQLDLQIAEALIVEAQKNNDAATVTQGGLLLIAIALCNLLCRQRPGK